MDETNTGYNAVQALIEENALLKEKVRKQEEEIRLLKSDKYHTSLINEMKAQAEEICQLREETNSDHISVLLNRKGFEQRVKNEISGTGRREDDSSKNQSKRGIFLMFDLDKFKPINDTHGHLAGDICLKEIGQVIKDNIRDTDSAARLGGDEFVVFLSGENIKELRKKAQTIQDSLNRLVVSYDDKSIDMGASMGVSLYSGSQSYDDLYIKADLKLYKDKIKRSLGKSEVRRIQPKTQQLKRM